jgi:hypothetical protein
MLVHVVILISHTEFYLPRADINHNLFGLLQSLRYQNLLILSQKIAAAPNY